MTNIIERHVASCLRTASSSLWTASRWMVDGNRQRADHNLVFKIGLLFQLRVCWLILHWLRAQNFIVSHELSLPLLSDNWQLVRPEAAFHYQKSAATLERRRCLRSACTFIIYVYPKIQFPRCITMKHWYAMASSSSSSEHRWSSRSSLAGSFLPEGSESNKNCDIIFQFAYFSHQWLSPFFQFRSYSAA